MQGRKPLYLKDLRNDARAINERDCAPEYDESRLYQALFARSQKSSEWSSVAIGRRDRVIYGSNHFANFIRRDGQGRLQPIRRSLGHSFS